MILEFVDAGFVPVSRLVLWDNKPQQWQRRNPTTGEWEPDPSKGADAARRAPPQPRAGD
jgi:hypothetical protein